MTNNQQPTTNNRGFTVFFAVLVGSLALAIGLAIFDLLVREVELSQTARESQFAIYAADTGAECALYWDFNYNGNESAFATSSSSNPPTSGINCNSQDVAAVAVTAGTWPQTSDASSAVTVFKVWLDSVDNTSPCATVTITKTTANPGDPPQTTMQSRGRNTSCDATTGLILERALEVNY